MKLDPLAVVGRAADPLLRRGTAALLSRGPEVPAAATALIAIDAAGLIERDPDAAARLEGLLELARAKDATIVEYAPGDTDPLSALRAGSTGQELRDRGIERVLVAGFATNVAVDSTARHCTELDFETKVIADCCAAATDAEHRASVETTLPRVTHGVWDAETARAALAG